MDLALSQGTTLQGLWWQPWWRSSVHPREGLCGEEQQGEVGATHVAGAKARWKGGVVAGVVKGVDDVGTVGSKEKK